MVSCLQFSEKCAADSILRYFSDNNETRAIFEKDKASLIQAKTFGLFGNNTIEHRFSSVLGNHLFCRLSSKNYLVRYFKLVFFFKFLIFCFFFKFLIFFFFFLDWMDLNHSNEFLQAPDFSRGSQSDFQLYLNL